jgi:hypothetical protein
MPLPDLPSPSQAPEGDEPRLTPREQAIYEELALIDAQLAGLFERGVSTLRQISRPGNVYVLAHIGRELSLGVIAALTGQGIAGAPPKAQAIPEDRTHVGVIAAALGLPAKHPFAKAWHATHGDLVAFAHYRRGEPPPSADQVVRAFQALADMLFGRIAPYFQTQRELDALLAVPQPDVSHIDRVKQLLLRPTQRSYFFRRLGHPRWLRPLLEAKLFAAPPDATGDAEGRYTWTGWPEGDYLVRMAPDEPQLVFEALRGIPPALRNPVVWYNAAQAALVLPPQLSRQLADTFAAALDGPVLFLFPRALLGLAIKLAEAGAGDAAFALADKLTELETREGDRRSPVAVAFGHNDVLLRRLDRDEADDAATQLLRALERTDALRCLELVAKRAAFAIRAHRAGHGEDSSEDYSWSWCKDLERADPILNELRALFLRAAAGVGRRYAARGETEAVRALEILERYDFDAFRRAELYVLIDAGRFFPARIDAALSDKSLIGGRLGDIEFGLLVARYLATASPATQAAFVAIVTAGPDRDLVRESSQAWLGRAPTDEEIAERVRVWQAERLAWFGDEVPEELRALADALAPTVARLATQDEELERRAAALSGERIKSPLTPDALRQMGTPELVAYLRTWSPGESDEASPTGLATALTDLVSAEPERVRALLQEMGDGVPPVYVQAIVSGLVTAAGSGKALPWPEALRLAGWTAGQSDPAAPKDVWRWAKREAARLITDAARKDLLPTDLADLAWAAVEALHAAEDTWHADGDRRMETELSGFYGVVSHALNAAAGTAVDTAMSLALWHYRQARRGAGLPGDPRRALPLLEQALDRPGTAGRAARVMIGQYVPWIMLLDDQWPVRHADRLFSGQLGGPDWDPAWGAYLARGRYFDNVFAKLRPLYVRAAGSLVTEPQDAQSRRDRDFAPQRHLALHIVVALVRGALTPGASDRLAELVFERASPDDLAHAYWVLFRDFADAKEPPAAAAVERLVNLWLWRLAELEGATDKARAAEEASGLGWLFMVSAMPDDAALALLVRTARIADGAFQMGHSLWERLGRLAGRDPASALEVASRLIDAELRSEHPHFNQAEVGPALQAALGASDAPTNRGAERLVHKLGDHGFTEFGNLLG